jgi:hypothetical protein
LQVATTKDPGQHYVLEEEAQLVAKENYVGWVEPNYLLLTSKKPLLAEGTDGLQDR